MKNETTFTPPTHRNPFLDQCCESLKLLSHNIPNLPSDSRSTNLNVNQWKALKALQTDKSIVIKELDKGGAFCIMDSQHYKDMVSKFLNPDNFRTVPKKYISLNSNNDHQTMKDLVKFIGGFQGILTKDESDYITKYDWYTANFYGLPKAHKSEIIRKAIKDQRSNVIITHRPVDLTVRPIVGGWASPTSRLSAVIDSILQPLVKFVPSYVKDEKNILVNIPWELIKSKQGNFVTFDIKDMYSNIKLDLALQGVHYWFTNYNEHIDNRFTWKFIRESIIFVMNHTTFEFDGKFYKQISGLAMGNRMSGCVADLSVGLCEIKLYNNLKIVKNPEYSNYVEKYLQRYKDDIFIYLALDMGDPSELQNFLNGMNSCLQFTMETSPISGTFLSIRIFKNSTDIFYKDTNAHAYMTYSSCHPRHVKVAIPFNLGNRIMERVSVPSTRNSRLQELWGHLLSRGYPKKLLLQTNNKLLNANKPSNSTEESPKSKFIISTTFNPRNPNIRGHIQTILDTLNVDSRMSAMMSKLKVTWAYKQAKNLKSLLCPSRYLSSTISGNSVNKCGGSKCELCQIIITGSSITMENGLIHQIKTKMNCNSLYVIYAVFCNACDASYIGQTEDLRSRTNLHKNQIKKADYRKLTVSKHIFSCGGKFKIIPFFKSKDNLTERECMEKKFIMKYKPSLNSETDNDSN